MLIENMICNDELDLSNKTEGTIFRYCKFEDFKIDGKSFDAVFLLCELINLDWYWGLFNGCIFIDTRFESCEFHGTNFADCRFLNCEFEDCQFLQDNLQSGCSFTGSLWFGCKEVSCIGFPEHAM